MRGVSSRDGGGQQPLNDVLLTAEEIRLTKWALGRVCRSYVEAEMRDSDDSGFEHMRVGKLRSKLRRLILMIAANAPKV